MMRKVLFCVLLWCCMSCQDDLAVLNDNMAGRWEINWEVEGESARGYLNLGNDHQGEIIAENPAYSQVLPGSYHVDIEWERTGNILKIKRMDNDFILSYSIIDEKETLVNLSFAGEVQVTLERLEE